MIHTRTIFKMQVHDSNVINSSVTKNASETLYCRRTSNSIVHVSCVERQFYDFSTQLMNVMIVTVTTIENVLATLMSNTLTSSIAIWSALRATDGVAHINGKLVLLIAAHVGVAHEIQQVAVFAGCWRDEVKFDLSLLLQGQALDGNETIGFGIANYHPPAFLTFLCKNTKDTIKEWSVYSVSFSMWYDQWKIRQIR